MSEEISIHDNQLLSYTVNCEENLIILRTVYRDREPYEYTVVEFSGVVAPCAKIERDKFPYAN